MFDAYKSRGGLNKARLTLIGLERTRFCEQKKDAPKKIKNRQLMENQKQIHFSQFDIHDFQGIKLLEGGRNYNLPFNIPVPADISAPSFEVSPVEQSMIDVTYFVEVVITEKGSTQTAKPDKKKKKGSTPMNSVFGLSTDTAGGFAPT